MRLTPSCAEALGGRRSRRSARVPTLVEHRGGRGAFGRALHPGLSPGAAAVAAVCFLLASPVFPQETAQALFSKALALERTLEVAPSGAKTGEGGPGVKPFRQAITAYEEVVRRYPRSGYCDDALWQAAQLALEAFRRFDQDRDHRTAARLLRRLVKEYPTSPFVRRAEAEASQLDAAAVGAHAPPPAAEPVSQPQERKIEPPDAPPLALLRSVRRTVLPEVVRVTLELDREVVFDAERIGNPPRVYIDLRDTNPSPAILEGTLTYTDDVVRKLRVGRRGNNVTRVVLEIDGVQRYSIFALYNPFRLVVDCERATAGAGTAAGGMPATAPPARPAAPVPRPPATRTPAGEAARLPLASATLRLGLLTLPSVVSAPIPTPALESRSLGQMFAALPLLGVARLPIVPPQQPATEAPDRPVAAPAAGKPAPPAANVGGGFSLARQLGLGVSHVVIDPGHGGHDPGAKGSGITEAAVVLDIALRLEALLLKEGVAATLTRRGDDYVPLEDRTAIANKAQADLFLSIHANASRNPQARGAESYFLNFATSPDAEAVAALENAASGRTMNDLADILKKITLNTKISESRDFAEHVQESLAQRLRGTHRSFKDLGVKQAPFVVLIEATMPSVLVEVSFITHGEEGRLLRNASYRQRIAQALLEGIRHYQASLKSAGNAAGNGLQAPARRTRGRVP
jgi:N-acetylmuramoyl-L-alanine amidase